uniref:Hexosyltransferase n=1 Tax=Aegilops tauschii TaxID=37682 RepID=M8CK84_AEGTA
MAPELAGKMTAKAAVAAPTRATKAYVTFLAGAGDYWMGVVGLAKGLRKVGSAYPLVVAVLPDVPELHRKILVSQGCIVREIAPVYPPENHTQFAMAYYVINYSKLRIWEFVEYERMVYLDADIQVFDNIDELFDLPKGHFYAVMDCFCEKTWSHTPHMATAKALLDTLRVTPTTPFAEQDFLNMFFREQYKPIPLVYNLVLAMLWRHPENVQLEKVKVVHYCAAGSKPWRFTGKEENMDREDIKILARNWWDIYNDESLDFKGLPALAADADELEAAAKKPLRAALAEAGTVKYVTAPSAA